MITVVAKNAPVSVVAFSGLAPKNWVFEFVKTVDRLACNVIGVRDPANDWYQTHKHQFAAEVQKAAQGKRLFLGASAGGFAALMFGRMLDADAVLAFSPQSACGDAKRALGDERWPEFCAATPSCDIAGEHPRATIHYDRHDALDAMHAGRLECRHVRHETGGHNLPDVLKRAGLLLSIIGAAAVEVGA